MEHSLDEILKDGNFGKWLRDELVAQDMTQAALAVRSNTTEAAVSRYISGIRTPQLVPLVRIVNALGYRLEAVGYEHRSRV